MAGIDTASEEPHRKRVTGGILRSSFQNPVYDIVRRSKALLARGLREYGDTSSVHATRRPLTQASKPSRSPPQNRAQRRRR